MIKESLHTLPINKLLNLLTKNNNELFAMERNKEDTLTIREKQKEVEVIQRILIAKKKEPQPKHVKK
jgi:hypothetical protein